MTFCPWVLLSDFFQNDLKPLEDLESLVDPCWTLDSGLLLILDDSDVWSWSFRFLGLGLETAEINLIPGLRSYKDALDKQESTGTMAGVLGACEQYRSCIAALSSKLARLYDRLGNSGRVALPDRGLVRAVAAQVGVRMNTGRTTNY